MGSDAKGKNRRICGSRKVGDMREVFLIPPPGNRQRDFVMHFLDYLIRTNSIIERMDERELEKILKAFANRRRILMLRILKRRKKISMGNMSKEIKLSFRSTSKHFSVLYAAGIVEREQEGLTMHYSLSPKPPTAAKQVLAII